MEALLQPRGNPSGVTLTRAAMRTRSQNSDHVMFCPGMQPVRTTKRMACVRRGALDWAGWDFEHETSVKLEVKQSAARQLWTALGTGRVPRFEKEPRHFARRDSLGNALAPDEGKIWRRTAKDKARFPGIACELFHKRAKKHGRHSFSAHDMQSSVMEGGWASHHSSSVELLMPLFARSERLRAGEVPDSSCSGSASDADACGRRQPRPAAEQQLCSVARCRNVEAATTGEIKNDTAIARIAEKIGWELNRSRTE